VASSGQLPEAVAALGQTLSQMVTRDQRVGPFEPAEAALAAATDRADPGDTKLHVGMTLALAGARSMRARATGDADLRRLARETLVEAERQLGEPAPTSDWIGPAWLIFAWSASQAMLSADRDAAPVVVRMADRLESLFAAHPELAEQLGKNMDRPPLPLHIGQGDAAVVQALRVLKQMVSLIADDGPLGTMFQANPGLFRSMAFRAPHSPPAATATRELATLGLARARSALAASLPDPEALRGACGDLRAALTGGLDDNTVRQEVNTMLGVCFGELYWLGERDARTLVDAIEHLNRALVSSEHRLPTPERAELLDRLARYCREGVQRGLNVGAGRDAERAVRAALWELARCVLVADGTEQALAIAARANEIVARAVGWCLADGRPEAAVEIAEAGRSLVLASVVLSGRVDSVLRGAGEEAAADAWGRDTTADKLTGLNALWRTRFGTSLLNTPTAQEISAMLISVPDVDGIVYLLPPASGDSDARAIVYRAGFGSRFEMIELPDVPIGTGSPLGDYLAAFSAALDVHDPAQRNSEGFRGTSRGRAWAQALELLGAWAHERIVARLVRHTRAWSLDHVPRLTLVPFGELAAVPYAAAWTADPGQPCGRRYAVHDLVLSHAVSARLLGEIARRPRQPLTEHVVLVPDPTGEFPYARATARTLTASLYPKATVYGRQAPHGPATVERILAALPGADQQGASLLHLSTHASTEPAPRLRTQDGWLALSRILEQARSRASDAAGGLIITNACLTDSTRSHFDESVTLATALLTAGATGVIGTRWPIDDDTTATLTYHLHQRLALGSPTAEALRLAQLDMLDPRPRPGLHPHLAALPPVRVAHPASWAAFTYHGT
jgi:hypothetical protein